MSSTSSQAAARTSTPITSFPLNPLPTYSPAPECSGVYLSDAGVFMIDDKRSCLPQNFNQVATAFYSPGTACPTGYTALPACTRTNALAPAFTTVTCCPVRRDLTLSCVSDPEGLANVFATLFCTWQAGPQTVLLATLTESGNVRTTAATLQGAQGVNAFGIRMVYQSSDLAARSTTAATTSSQAPPLPTVSVDSNTEGGLSSGETAAIAVVVPLLLIAIIGGAWFWMRRKRAAKGGIPKQDHAYEVGGGEVTYARTPGRFQNGSPYQPSELTTPSQNDSAWYPPKQPAELEVMGVPAELPSDGPRRR